MNRPTPTMFTVKIDTEELEALIDFQRSMADGAHESCELEEWAERKGRMAQLMTILSPIPKKKNVITQKGPCDVADQNPCPDCNC